MLSYRKTKLESCMQPVVEDDVSYSFLITLCAKVIPLHGIDVFRQVLKILEHSLPSVWARRDRRLVWDVSLYAVNVFITVG